MNFGKNKARSFERKRQFYGAFFWGLLSCLALLTSLTTGAFGAVVADFSALRSDRDPTSQGWVGELINGPGRDIDSDGLIDSFDNSKISHNVGPVEGGFWQVIDRERDQRFRLPGYYSALSPEALADALEFGWTFEATFRVRQNGDDGFAGFIGWGLTSETDPGWGAPESSRVGLVFGLLEGNTLELRMEGGFRVRLGDGSGNDAHTIRMEGAPRSALFELYVDDKSYGVFDLRTEGSIAGLASDRVYFGARSSNAIGGAINWRSVAFSTGEPLPRAVGKLTREIHAHADSIIGNGIDAATGSFQRGFELLSLTAAREISFSIYYDSRLTSRRGPLGYGWSHPFEARLLGRQNEDVVIQWDRHRSSRFNWDPIGREYVGVDPDVRYAKLESILGELTMLDGTTFNFEPSGELTNVSNRAGQGMEILDEENNHRGRFKRISDNYSNKDLFVEYNEVGLISKVTDPMGREVHLGYDTGDRLVSVSAPVQYQPAFLFQPDGESSELVPDNDPEGLTFIMNVEEEGLVGLARFRRFSISHSEENPPKGTLTSPEGTTVDLRFVSENASSPYLPEFDFAAFDGESRQGDWRLNLVDDVSDGRGARVWGFEFQLTYGTQTVFFTYDENHRIVSGADLHGETLFTNEYDELGRVIRQDDGRPDTPPLEVAYAGSQNGVLETVLTDPLGHQYTYEHDDNFNLLSVTNPLGHRVSFDYDRSGNRVSRTDARGNTTRFAYDGFGNLASVTLPGNDSITFQSSEDHNLLSITDALGNRSQFGYSDNRLTRVEDALGHVDRKVYFPSGQLKSTILHDEGALDFEEDSVGLPVRSSRRGHTVSRAEAEYDDAGRLIRNTDANGRVTEIVLDGAGNVLREIDSNGHAIVSLYDHRGRLERKIDRRGFATDFEYDGNNNVLRSVNALGGATAYTYDALNRVVSIVDPNGEETTFAYDAVGRRIATTDALGRTTRREYDANGNVVAAYLPNGVRVLKLTYDERDLPVRFEDAQGHVSVAEYDAVGRRTSVTDARGRTTTYTYDELDRLRQVVDPLGRTANKSYFSDDVVRWIQTGESEAARFTYDTGNNLTGVSLYTSPPGSEARLFRRTDYVYNRADRLAQINFHSGWTVRFNYDSAGRMTANRITLPASGSSFDARDISDDFQRGYNYDASGNLLTVNALGINVTPRPGRGSVDVAIRTYDALGRMTTFTDELGNVIEYTYDAVGNLSALTYPDSWEVSYRYDAARRLIEVTDGDGRKTTYTWNSEDQLTGVTHPNGTVRHLEYDQLGRLTLREDLQANGGVIARFVYHYDANGELESEEMDPLAPLAFENHALTYNDAYELQTVDGAPVAHDRDGNMISGPPGLGLDSLAYNARGRLVSTDAYLYDYDEEDQLVGWTPKSNASDSSRFLVNPSPTLRQILMKTDGDGTVTRYVYGVGLIYQVKSEGARTYHYDHRGSTIALSDDAGAVVGRIAFNPYGKIVHREGETETPFLFNGLYGVVTSPDDLAFMRFRWYWPEIGRFLTPDAHLGDIGSPSSLNLYAYGHGNPVTRIDPEGEFPWVLAGAFAGGLINTYVTLTVDYLDDGQINRDPSEYAGAFVAGAVGGGLAAATFGASGAVAVLAAVGTGAAAAAAGNVTEGLLSGDGVDGEDLAKDTAIGGATGLLTFGAGKAFGRLGNAAFNRFANKPYVGRVVRTFFTPAKVANRRAAGSLTEIVERDFKARALGIAKRSFFGYFGGVAMGATKAHQSRAIAGISNFLTGGAAPQGETSIGTISVYLDAAGEINRGRARAYGEYRHFDLYLRALETAGRPVPNNPTSTLVGF